MPAAQVPEFLMSLLHSSMVHQVALSTFQQQQQKNSSSDTEKKSAPASNASFNSVDKSAEFYHRLESLGFSIGLRAAERLLASTPVASNNSTERPQDDAINLLRTVLWPSLFGKELGRENDPASAANANNNTAGAPPVSPATVINSNNGKTTAGGGDVNNNLVYKLIDVDFSWVRSVALTPEAQSLADPFIRGMNYDLLEDPSTFAAGISAMMTSNNNNNESNHHNQKSHHNQKQHHNTNSNNNASSTSTSASSSSGVVTTGPNDYVVLLTGMILGFLSSLGFGSHAERRVFGGSRALISSTLNNNNNGSSFPPSAAITPKTLENNNNNNTIAAASSAVISRSPSSFVTVRHRLMSREGEAFRPSGMQLKLVIHFS